MLGKIFFLLPTLFFFIWLEAAAVDSVGTVIAVRGTVYAENKVGVKRSLQRRSKFYLYETIKTQENSQAQLKLKDDTLISLKPHTGYFVSVFKVDKKNAKNNRYIGNLVEGVLISMSGQGENSSHAHHVLKTPVVTIAVRGTLFECGFKISSSSDYLALAKKIDAPKKPIPPPSRKKPILGNKKDAPKKPIAPPHGKKSIDVIGVGWIYAINGNLGVEVYNAQFQQGGGVQI